MTDDLTAPHAALLTRQAMSANIFRDVFGRLADEEWLEVLKRSATEPRIDDVLFPGFPAEDIQMGLHGSAGAAALDEAFAFYRYIKAQLGDTASFAPGARLLDFGCGWGRMIRPFLRDFNLCDIYGYEPNPVNCFAARAANPFVSILSGEYLPNRRIPRDTFDLMTGYSVFSHLSPHAIALWLRETADVLRPGGHAVFTTWGLRFLDYLLAEKSRMDAGEDIHWYARHSIARLGDLEDIRKRYMAGALVWVDLGISPLYGETFMGSGAIQQVIRDNLLPLDLIVFDTEAIPQDVFILQRT